MVDRYDPDIDKVLAYHRATAVRADYSPPVPKLPLRSRLNTRLTEKIMCPACLLPRFVPGHKLRGCR